MENEKKDPKEQVEEETTEQDGQPVETKSENQPEDTGQKNEDSKEEVLFEKDGRKYTAKDLEDMENKARDFDGIIEKRRLAKLKGDEDEKKPEEKVEKDGEDLIPISKVQEMIKSEVSKVQQNLQTESFNQGLSEAYKEFVKDFSWANSDEAFSKIKENFNSAGEISKEGLLNRLKIAAQNAFPEEYIKTIEERVKSKTFIEETKINAGDGGGGVSDKKEFEEDITRKATAEDKRIADSFFGGNVEKYLKFKREEK